jgi:hypothetical protein
LPRAAKGTWHLGSDGEDDHLWVFYVKDMAFQGTEEWAQICEWLQFHRIDPQMVPINSAIIVDYERHSIGYLKVKFDKHGRIPDSEKYLDDDGYVCVREHAATEQGEAGPVPLPKILKELS